MNELIRKFKGANMDIDLATPVGVISWEQDKCCEIEQSRGKKH